MNKENNNTTNNNSSEKNNFSQNINHFFSNPNKFIIPTFFISTLCLLLTIITMVGNNLNNNKMYMRNQFGQRRYSSRMMNNENFDIPNYPPNACCNPNRNQNKFYQPDNYTDKDNRPYRDFNFDKNNKNDFFGNNNKNSNDFNKPNRFDNYNKYDDDKNSIKDKENDNYDRSNNNKWRQNFNTYPFNSPYKDNIKEEDAFPFKSNS